MASWNDSVDYELNSTMNWEFDKTLPTNIPIWVLVEEDTCDPTAIPTVMRLIYEPDSEPRRKLRLLDFDPDAQDEYLDNNCYTIMAWRLMTQHAGTWDKHYADSGITEMSNWIVDLDEKTS